MHIILFVAALLLAIPVAGATTTATWFTGSAAIDLPMCSSCEVTLLPSGTSGLGSLSNPGNSMLSPGAPVIATKLSVHLHTAPGGNATRRFFLFVRTDIAHSINCDIKGAQTSCNSGTQTLAVPAASLLIIDTANIGNAAATGVEWSWAAVPQ